jgi:hypothetical protein
MINPNIPSAFSLLIEEFEKLIHDINREGSKAFSEKRYSDVSSIATYAKSVEGFQSRLAEVEDQWDNFCSAEGVTSQQKTKRSISFSGPRVNFHLDCLEKVKLKFGSDFTKVSRTSYESADSSRALVLLASKIHEGTRDSFWFGLHPHHLDFLKSKNNGVLALGCGGSDKLFLFPRDFIESIVPKLGKTVREDGTLYWHVVILPEAGRYNLKFKGRGNRSDITKYLLG